MDAETRPQFQSRSITIAYSLSLLFLGILATIFFLVLLWVTDAHRTNMRFTAISADQRMLVYRAAFCSLRLVTAETADLRKKWRDTLKKTADSIAKNHQFRMVVQC